MRGGVERCAVTGTAFPKKYGVYTLFHLFQCSILLLLYYISTYIIYIYRVFQKWNIDWNSTDCPCSTEYNTISQQ